jgi:hypothetical protein
MSFKFSATSLDGYTKCPLYFKHRWVDYWKEPVFEGSAFGVALHEAAAHWLMDRNYVPNFEELLIAAKVENPTPELIQITEAYYANWVSHQTDAVPIAVEREIKLEHPTLGMLVGKIDAVYKEEAGLRIVDHKFLKNVNKKKPNHQMAFYSILVPGAVKFQFEKVGLEDYQIQETSSLSVALRNIEKTIYYINEGKFDANPQRWFVEYCPFLKECGACLK